MNCSGLWSPPVILMSQIETNQPRTLLLTVREAQGYLSLGRTQLHGLCKAGTIRVVKIGKRGIRVPLSEIERFVAERLGA